MDTRMSAPALALAALLGCAGTAFGQAGSTPTQADFDACNKEASRSVLTGSSPRSAAGAGVASGGATTGGSTLRSGGEVVTPGVGSDAQTPLLGMSADGANDPEYQRAYRQCLRRRGF